MEHQEPGTPKKPMTKTEIIASLSETTDLTKQQVAKLFDELAVLIKNNLGEQGPGIFDIPSIQEYQGGSQARYFRNIKGSTRLPRKRRSSKPSPPRTWSSSSR